ncbi:MAG: MotA/TolQ/ExbB proton channel family protein [Micavibrio aeruginosavorus]|uniref:MotA/TolQ/ExbB proton channel family protein n=1 Tax=Micavibrio aeruginosavorus TaxID=349221 RepID=A0A7T5UH01_9BACT|nr:MAG: MotA/TolQ/ExbB proton channel family protein [Micavibrio aeruginosavorus]
MTTDSAQSAASGSSSDITVRIRPPSVKPDMFTIFGILCAIGLIVGAIAYGQSNASFLDIPSIMIVVLGTIAATCISYTGEEIGHVWGILGSAMVRRIRKPSVVARQLMDIAALCRKKGTLILSSLDAELRRDMLIHRAMQLVVDGYSGDDVDRVLGQEVDSLVERHRRSASILRRASEIAPAMGLIGTLVGLVQMLAALDDPNSIGPAMALALLTTFYGAIMGLVLLAPLAGKLERNSNDEAMIRIMIMNAAISIARQENPRRLEMILNSDLPPDERIKYFD